MKNSELYSIDVSRVKQLSAVAPDDHRTISQKLIELGFVQLVVDSGF